MSKLIMSIIIIFLIVTPLRGFFVFNGGELLFCLDCEKIIPIKNNVDINSIIIEGAENFLKSYSNTLMMLSHIESGNNGNLKRIVNGSIKSMEKAKYAYNELKNFAWATPYDYMIIEKLKYFDYQSFFKSKTGLNPAVFEQVEIFLSNGDVRGAFNLIEEKVSSILENLYIIKSDIDVGVMPEIPVFWNLNQMYTNTQLFGQYLSQIIYEIKKE